MIIGMQLTAVVSLEITAPLKADNISLETAGMLTLSRDENMVVFVVDTLDAQFFEELFLE